MNGTTRMTGDWRCHSCILTKQLRDLAELARNPLVSRHHLKKQAEKALNTLHRQLKLKPQENTCKPPSKDS